MTNKKGVVLLLVLVILVGLSLVAFAFLSMSSYEIKSAGAGLLNMRAFYIAEAGRAKARRDLTTGAKAPGWGESDISFGGGTYTYTTAYSDAPAKKRVTITSYGYIPNNANPIARRTVVEKDIPFSAQGTNLSLATNGTTAKSSPYQGQNVPEQTIDGSGITGWVSSVKAISRLALNYGSQKSVSRVVVSGSKIISVVVKYSNNDTVWNDVTSDTNWTDVSNPSGALPGTRTFTAVNAKYLKLVITSDTNDKAQVNEFESYTSASGTPTLDKGSFVTSW